MRRWGFLRPLPALAVIIVVAGPSSRAGATTVPANLPVESFANLPYHNDIELSQDGRFAAATLRMKDGKYGVVIYDLDAIGKKPPLLASPGDWDVNWVHWKNPNRLLVSARYANRRYGTAVIETRLIAINADGTEMKYVLEPKLSERQAEKIIQIQDHVIDYLPDDPRRVMLAFNPDDPARPRLYKVDVYTSSREQLETGKATIQSWLADRQGRVRIAQGRSVLDGSSEGYKTYYRATEKEDWREIWDADENDADFDPRLFDRNDPDVVLATSDHENGTTGLYRYRLSSGQFVETLFHDPKVDIDHIYFNPRGDEIEGVRYVTDVAHNKWFSEETAALYRDLQKLLPGWGIQLSSRSEGNRRVVVEAEASDHSARYYLYEPATKNLKYFVYTYPELDQYDLARTVAVRYKARDGLEIPAYLTLPIGTTNPPSAPLAAVIFPHGGPEARDYAAFDPMVQMMVNRGYAVLQTNFRGSTGYGAEFREAGTRQWGEAMQDDVTDGTLWLAQQKIADPARICIVGGSYGGYAALMGVVKEPKLYRCAVSLNGVSDLPDFIVSKRHYVGGAGTMDRLLGGIWSDRERLTRNSPSRRADEIQTPVLLIHGTKDRVVLVTQSRKMVGALKSAGKTHRYVELEDEEHWLTHNDTRVQAYRELDEFLAKHLH